MLMSQLLPTLMMQPTAILFDENKLVKITATLSRSCFFVILFSQNEHLKIYEAFENVLQTVQWRQKFSISL